MDSRTPCSLLNLPPELAVQVVSHLDFASLSRFIRVSRRCHDLFRAHVEPICRTVSIRQGLADPKTASATAALAREPFPARRLDDDLDPQELERVVRAQRWLGVDSVPSWHEYAKRAHSIDRNWLAGKATSCCLVLDWLDGLDDFPFAEGTFWRFKLDIPPGYIVVSGRNGGTFAFRRRDGKLMWSSKLPADPFPHIELSEGYLIQQATSTTYIALRRADVPGEPPDGHGHLWSTLSRLVGRLIGGAAAVGYDCAFIAETSFPCFASKLRLPKLLASSADGQQVHLWDLVERKVETLAVPEFVDVSEDGQVYYVELDDEVIYLAGQHGVLVVRPDLGVDDPLRSRIWPPKAPEGMRHLLEHAWYSRECEGVGWEAVHHGGSHLIGISRRSDQDDLAKLVWTCDKRSIWGDDDGAEADRKTAVLVIEGADPVQLAVENDRAVFILYDEHLGSSLWLLNLRSPHDWDDPSSQLPQPICLAYPLPTLGPPSRVEMTSSEIYVPALASFFPPPSGSSATPSRLSRAFAAMQRQVPRGKSPFVFRWENLERSVVNDAIGPSAVEGAPLPGWDQEWVEDDFDDLDDADWDDSVQDAGSCTAVGLRMAWEKVRAAARADEVDENLGGSDAFAVWSFDAT